MAELTRTDSAPPPEANPPVLRGPSPSGPRIPGPVETAVLFWRWLRRMRSALYLLGVVGLLTLIATVVPQEPNVPTTVADWRAGTEGPGTLVSGLIDAIGGYDVFGSPAFLTLLALLFISLTACLIPRYRAWWRLVRRSRPPRSRTLETQPYVQHFETTAPPERAREVGAAALRERRWRLRDADADDGAGAPQVAAERGHALREGGSLLFHTAFYLLLIAVVSGQLLGFSGEVGIVEGKSWAETAVGYWTYDPGRFWGDGDHRGFVMTLDEFEVDWHRDPQFAGQPSKFLSRVTIEHPDGTTEQDTVGGNDPLIVDGMRIHQLDWGYAPRVVVFQDGEVVHDDFLTLSATEGQAYWHGAVKAPAAEPQVGVELFLVPNAPEGDNGPTLTGAPWADAPALAMDVYRGDLRLNASQNVNELDKTALELTDEVPFIRPGQVAQLPGGITVAFPELRRWVGFQVSNKPSVPLLLLSAVAVLIGLLSALYAYRRRVWIDATDHDGTTLVTVAGRTFQRPQAFEPEFDGLVTAIREALPPAHDTATDGPAPRTPTSTEVMR